MFEVEYMICEASLEEQRAVIYSQPATGLLSMKLHLVETLGILELHSRPDNEFSAWYQRQLNSLLEIVEDAILRRTGTWHD